MLIVSKCLTGCPCRYDGQSKPDPRIAALVVSGEAVAVCPEQLGGLPTPRTPSELTGTGEDVLDGLAKVVTKDGRDVTAEFIRGAEAALAEAVRVGAGSALLKARSPSCGLGEVYDGTFSGALTEGNGVTAALLMRKGIKVISV